MGHTLRDSKGRLIRAEKLEDLTPEEFASIERQIVASSCFHFRLMRRLEALQWPGQSHFMKAVRGAEHSTGHLRAIFDEVRRLEGVARYYESIRGVPITPCPPSPPQTPAPPPAPSAAAPTTTNPEVRA